MAGKLEEQPRVLSFSHPRCRVFAIGLDVFNFIRIECPTLNRLRFIWTLFSGPTMSARFYLPCPSCEHRLEVETRSAGRQLTCPECSGEVEAPNMGGIRRLDPVATEEKASGRKVQKSGRTKAVLFSIGLAILVICGGLGAGLYNYSSRLEIPIDMERGIENQNVTLDGLRAPALWDFYFETMKDAPLGDWEEHVFTKANIQGSILKNFSYGFFGIAGLGLLMLLASFFVGGKK